MSGLKSGVEPPARVIQPMITRCQVRSDATAIRLPAQSRVIQVPQTDYPRRPVPRVIQLPESVQVMTISEYIEKMNIWVFDSLTHVMSAGARD